MEGARVGAGSDIELSPQASAQFVHRPQLMRLESLPLPDAFRSAAAAGARSADAPAGREGVGAFLDERPPGLAPVGRLSRRTSRR